MPCVWSYLIKAESRTQKGGEGKGFDERKLHVGMRMNKGR
jgi:hypothetical protein